MPNPIPHPSWIAIGVALIVVGILLIRWANRNNLAAAASGAVTDAALAALRRRKVDVPQDIRDKLDDVLATPSQTGRAKKVAGYAVRHALAQLAGIVGFVIAVAGLVAAVLGLFYA